MSSATLRPDAGRLGDLLRRGREQRVDGAELLGEVAAGDVADALDPDREQDASRTAARCERLDRARARFVAETSPMPSSSSSCSRVRR